MEEKSDNKSWKLNNPEQGIIEISASGILDAKVSKLQAEEAFGAAKKENSFLFLLNYRNLEPGAPLLRIYELPVLYHELGIPRLSKIAIVPPAANEQGEDYGFYETMCHNHGYDVRFFEEQKHALDWLRLHKKDPLGR
jgi:hypothetical protein